MKQHYIIILFVFLLLLNSCENNEVGSQGGPGGPGGPGGQVCTEDVSYTDDVQPIIAANCAISGCHNGDGNPSGPGVNRNWNEFNLVQQNAQKIKTAVVNHTMPPDSQAPLSEAQIQAIACWVDQGAKNN